MAKVQPLRFDIITKTQNGTTIYEATANIPGFRPSYVEKIENGCTQFSTRSSIIAACRNRAATLGLAPVVQFEGAEKVAAQASIKTPAKSRLARIAIKK